MSEAKLMKLKREIEQNEQKIQRNEGKLESLIESYKKELNLPSKIGVDGVLKKMQAKVAELKKQLKNDQNRFDTLMEQIETEVEAWEDLEE